MLRCYLAQADGWYRDSQAGYVRGFAFVGDKFLQRKALLDYLREAIRLGQLEEALHNLNGFFSVVLSIGDTTWLIADKQKSYPLLYGQAEGDFIVGNRGEEVAHRLEKPRLNTEFVPTFLALGYLWGCHTLYEDCWIVPAESYVRLQSGVATLVAYGRKRTTQLPASMDDYYRQAADILDRVFRRFVQVLGNRPVVLPLSGGYDSRLLACLCKKHDLKEVICFTYGTKENPEVEVSKYIANQFGFPWHFVEYTTEKWKKIIKEGTLDSYLRFAGNLNAIGHIQDFLAIRELLASGVIPPHAIVVPGHTGDVLGGSHLPLQRLDAENLPLRLYDKYYELNILTPQAKKQALTLLRENLPPHLATEEACLEAFYDWGKQARQSNFIINSVRVYEYLGLDWYLPLWDDEYVQHWESLSFTQKRGSDLYNRFMFRHYFVPYGVDKEKDRGAPSSGWRQILTTRLNHDQRSLLKHYLEKWRLRKPERDFYALDEVGNLLQEQYALDKKREACIRMSRLGSMSRKAQLYLKLLVSCFS